MAGDATQTETKEVSPFAKLKNLETGTVESSPTAPTKLTPKEAMEIIQQKLTTKPLKPDELPHAGENRPHPEPGAKVLATPDMDQAVFNKQRQPGSTG
jgi:hypothetical protein